MFYTPIKSVVSRRSEAFTLIEMVAVIAILVTLMTASVSLLNGTGTQARRAATETFISLVEQARTSAITYQSTVVLAIIEPTDLPDGEDRCRVGIFKIKEWTDDPGSLEGILLNRWQALHRGVILMSGEVSDIPNLMDSPKITLTYGGAKQLAVSAHVLAFHSYGGLQYPQGSTSVIARLAEGGYRNGIAAPNHQGTDKTIPENLLKIGRVTGRPYRIDR